MSPVGAHGRALLWFALGNLALLCADALGYRAAAPSGATALADAFLAVAMLGQLATATLAVILPLLAILHLPGGPRVVAVLAPLLLGTLQLFVFLDRKMFALFHFHLNGLVVNVLTTPGGWASMHVRNAELAATVAAVLGFFAAEVAAYRLLVRRCARDPRPAGRAWRALAAAAIACVVVDHVAYAVGDIANRDDVTRSARLVPLYQPLTIRHLVRRWTRLSVDDVPRLAAPAGAGALRYPRAPLRFHDPARRPNVVWMVLDSWRAGTFTEENTPEAWRLGQRAQVFRHHLSGGNSTRNGIFTMFYGLHGAYWQSVLAEHVGPVLMRRVLDLGYRVRVLSSSSLTFPEFRRTVFVDVPDTIADAFSGATAAVKDRQLTEALAAFVGQGEGPFFAFLFFDSSHAPYDFPPESARYRPYAATVRYTALDDPAQRGELLARYRNAVFYADHLVGGVVRDLEARGLLDDTIVIATGDHGEEVYEHGYYGHNGAFTPEQIQVPLVLHVPGLPPAVHEGLTGHEDLPATLLELLGVENPPGDYSLGRSLLHGDGDPYEVSCGWDQCALVDAAGTVVFGMQAYKGAGIDVLDADYRAVAEPRRVLAARSPQLVGIMTELSAFLR